jgi:hypothetical protein
MLNNIFTGLPPGVLLEVFLDCCHSGTGLHDLSLGRPAELEPEYPVAARFLPPPVDIVSRYEGEEEELKPIRGFRTETRSTVHHILWAGCKDNQTSADAHSGGTYNGAFTYYFCKHMRDTGGQISRQELLTRIRNSLRHGGDNQLPQLECEATMRKGRALVPPG